MTALLDDRRAVALLMVATLTIMANATISPALPGIEARHADLPDAALLTRLLVTAPSLMVAVLAPFAGFAADRLGRRRLLLAGVMLFALAGSIGLVITDLHALLASRLVLGIAVALVMTSQAALVGDYFAGEARGRFMGYQMAATSLGGFVFVSVAGWLAGIAPHWPFAIYALGFFYLPYLVRAIVEPGQTGSRPQPAEASAPAEPAWRLLLGLAILLLGLTFLLLYVMPTQIPYYLARIGHPAPAATAAVMGAVVLSSGAFSVASGRLRQRLGRALPPMLGLVLMAAGFWALPEGHSIVAVMAAAAAIGGGLGLVVPNLMTAALDAAPAHRRGLAMGAATTSIFLGQFLSPVVSQPLIEALGYAAGFRALAAFLLLLALVTLAGLRGAPGGPPPKQQAPGRGYSDRPATHRSRAG